jgi:hypothetical protein
MNEVRRPVCAVIKWITCGAWVKIMVWHIRSLQSGEGTYTPGFGDREKMGRPVPSLFLYIKILFLAHNGFWTAEKAKI